jgi:23S rRNA maturation-related 3'-5' exoribonuclease YhaM
MKNKFKFPEVFESQEFKKRVESAIEHHLYLELNQHDYVHINEAKAIMRIFKCVDSERLIANIIDNYLRVGRHDRFDCIVKIVDNFYI